MGGLQAALGPRGVRRGGDVVRTLGAHLAPGHRALQQVSVLRAVRMCYYRCILISDMIDCKDKGKYSSLNLKHLIQCTIKCYWRR